MKTGGYLIVKRSCLKEDNWRYGEWRQYVAFVDEERAYPCRCSTLPLFAALGGLVLLGLAFTGVAAAAYHGIGVYWDRVAIMSLVGFLLIGPELLFYFSQWRLVKTVGPQFRRTQDGYFRVFDHEVE